MLEAVLVGWRRIHHLRILVLLGWHPQVRRGLHQTRELIQDLRVRRLGHSGPMVATIQVQMKTRPRAVLGIRHRPEVCLVRRMKRRLLAVLE